MNDTTLIDVIALARAFLEAGRCRGPMATDGQGGDTHEMHATDSRATHFCLSGSIQRALYELDSQSGVPSNTANLLWASLTGLLRDALADRKGEPNAFYGGLWDYNDVEPTTDEDVLSLFDDAAARINPK